MPVRPALVSGPGPPPGTGRVDLISLLATADRTLLRRYGHFYIPQRRPRYLRRNALVALGNTGDGRRWRWLPVSSVTPTGCCGSTPLGRCAGSAVPRRGQR